MPDCYCFDLLIPFSPPYRLGTGLCFLLALSMIRCRWVGNVLSSPAFSLITFSPHHQCFGVIGLKSTCLQSIGLITRSVQLVWLVIPLLVYRSMSPSILSIGLITRSVQLVWFVMPYWFTSLKWTGPLFFCRLLILWIQVDWFTNSKPTFHEVSADSIQQAWRQVHC